MAKRNTINIDVMVNGKMEKATVDAKKLRGALDGVEKSARTTDRNLKGAAQATSNSTKAFSKMGQGMGGLVAVYASFAAQVFALTALFNGLKRAADLENLRKSQVSFATSTGLAIQSLTANLREASQGMLGFQEAAQAATIGVAKGFSGGQLEELVVGATKASAALGRNFDDTFDRLLRGVSKAEPELLDELGITLRLEEATNRYAEAIGTTRDKLTTAQRSQAVFVETMRQLNSTFGEQEAQTNPFVQLAKTFEDISQTVVQKVMPPIESLVNLINKNAQAAATAFGALALLVASNLAGVSAGVGLVFGKIGGFAKGVVGLTASVTGTVGKKTGGFISNAAKNLSDEIEFAELLLEEAVENTTSKLATGAEKALAGGATSKTLEKIKKGELISPQALGKLEKDLKRVQKEIEETGETSSKAFAGMTVDAIKDMRKELKHFKDNTVSYGTRAKKVFGKIVVGSIKAVRKTAQLATYAVRKLGEAGEFARNNFGRLKSVMKFGGIVLTGIIVLAKAVDQLAESPIRVIDGFKKMVGSTIKLVGRMMNFIIDGLNRLLDNSLVKSVFKDGIKIGQVDTSGVDEFLDNMETKILTRLGTSREELQVVQNTNDARKKAIEIEEERIERVKQLVKEYDTLFADFENILKGLDPTNIPNVARAMSTLDIAGAVKQLSTLQKEQQAAEAFMNKPGLSDEDRIAAIYRSMNIDAEFKRVSQTLGNLIGQATGQLPATFVKAAQEALNDPTNQAALDAVIAQQLAASSMLANKAELDDALNNLRSTIGTGDPLEQEMGLKRINTLIQAIDGSLKQLYGDDTQTNTGRLARDLLGADAAYLQSELQRIRIELDGITDARGRLARDAAMEGAFLNTSGMREETSRQRGVSSAELNLKEAIALRQQLNLVKVDDDDISKANHARRVAEANTEIALANAKLMAAKRNLEGTNRLADTAMQSLEDGMASAINSIVQGTATIKEAFASMALSVLRALSQMISQMIAVRIMQSLIGMAAAPSDAALTQAQFGQSQISADAMGAANTSLGAIPQGRTGGIFSDGRKMSGYATGGVAKGPSGGYPAMLHGTEAVVPLPNGKSIPVHMEGGANQQNNVTVNVSVDNDGQAQQDAPDAQGQGNALGRVIAQAVQKELQNQKRAGGILNPYGAA